MAQLVRYIQAGADDGHIDGTSFYNTGALAYFGQWQSTSVQHMYFRFDNITVPAGATITSAYLTLRFGTRLSGADDLDATIYGEDADDPNALDSYSGGSDAWVDRTQTTASVAWLLDDSWTDDTDYDSPNIGTIIAEIIGRSGWASGQAIMLYVEDEGPTPVGNEANFETYEDTNYAYLTINYETSVPKTGTDSGTLAESSTRDIGPQSTDSGTVSESGSVDAQATATDTATLAEASAQQEYQDKGPATDSATLAESAVQASRAWTPPQLRVEAGFGHEWNRYDIKGAIEFGGLANEYVKADHINLIDADSAHIHQSKGQHVSNNGTLFSCERSTLRPVFGDGSLRFEVLVAASNPSSYQTVRNFTVTPSTTYTFSVDGWSDVGGRALARIDWRDSGGAHISHSIGAAITIGDAAYSYIDADTGKQWTRFHVTAQAPTGAVTAYYWIRPELRYPSTSLVGDDWYLGRFTFCEGDETAFVPSMRLVGDAEVNMYLDGYWPFVSAPQHILGVDWGGTDRMMGIWTLAIGSDQVLRFSRENTSSAEIFSSFTLPQIPFREDLKIRITDDISIARRWCYIKSAVGNAIDWNAYVDETAYTPTPGDATYPFCVGTAAGFAFWWNGSIRDITLHDGIYGPIVARFLADDYIAANPPTGWNEIKYSIADSETWEDETGHVWEVVDT